MLMIDEEVTDWKLPTTQKMFISFSAMFHPHAIQPWHLVYLGVGVFRVRLLFCCYRKLIPPTFRFIHLFIDNILLTGRIYSKGENRSIPYSGREMNLTNKWMPCQSAGQVQGFCGIEQQLIMITRRDNRTPLPRIDAATRKISSNKHTYSDVY